VSFTIGSGETLGLVGESGCGKTTVGRTILRLIEPTAGTIRLDGRDVTHLGKLDMRPFRREMQIIFQDPFSSLNPRMRAGDIVGEPLKVHGVDSKAARRERVARLFDRVGLRAAQMDAFPHQFSGGQRQRIGVARALALNPKLIVGDEPVSALDVTIQAQILEVIAKLRRELGTAVILITHDLGIVAETAERVIVMYAGRKVEEAGVQALFDRPIHPYTRGLINSIPRLALMRHESTPASERLLEIPGMVPALSNLPPGCAFAPRCAHASDVCRREYPPYEEKMPGQWAACWHAERVGELHGG